MDSTKHDHHQHAPAGKEPLAHQAPALDTDRPFGAHLRLSWWKPVVLIVALPVTLVLLQIVATVIAGVVEGSDDPFSTEFTPIKSLAVNVSIAVTGIIAVLILARMARVPWRALLTPVRSFDGHRLSRYTVLAVLLVGLALGAVALVAPESTGWTGFAVSGTTVALLFVTVLSTPLQAAGEELIYRAVLLPAAASWLRAVRPALVVGVIVSTVSFAAAHASTDPWLLTYFAVVAASTALMAIFSGGLEAPIAFHVVNNVLAGVVGNLFSDGGTTTIDRAAETGHPSLLLIMAANVAMVAVVWARERPASVERHAE